MAYSILNGPIGRSDFTFYGGAREAARCKDPEVMLHGPAETGKTMSVLFKLHLCACKYPQASIVMMRKTQTSIYPTVIKMFNEKVLDADSPITVYGGEKPEWYDYWNGSRIWVTGMDKASRILSGEHDIIALFQAEEFTEDEWEHCTTRTTGRADHMPYGQTLGDMNPTYPQHWPYHRASMRMFQSVHKDNPTLYDQETGEITVRGKKTMRVLEALTGARRIRLLVGKPAQVEGAIYTEWNGPVHLKYAKNCPPFLRYVAGVDWGYKQAGVIGIWGIDGRNGDAYLVAQYYHTMKTDDWWRERALELHQRFSRVVVRKGGPRTEYLIEAWICDPSQPAYIDKFKAEGLNAKPAYNGVLPGINAVKTRLKNNSLFVVRDSLLLVDDALKDNHHPYQVQDEWASYVWADSQIKEVPIKTRDHGMDMTRYVVCYLDDVGQDPILPAGAW